MVARPRIDADVCVVGAGIVGLAHALEARRRGLSVVVVERNERAVGASVRNFGHCFISATAAGETLDCALTARERWLTLGAQAGLPVQECGSVVVARHEDELAVMQAMARDERRGARVITPAEATRLAPISPDRLVGALHCRHDLRVDPRRAVAALAALLERDSGARVLWKAPVHDVAPGAVECARASVRAAHVLLCPGPDYDLLPAGLAPDRDGLTRTKLQMLRVGAPAARRYGPALLTGLSILRYPGFSDLPEAEAVRIRLKHERPDLLAAGIHLIVTQLPGGDLVVGDTHEYGDTVSPFGQERLDALVLEEAGRLLGVDALEVRERWQGVYPTAPGHPFLVEEPMAGVRLVEVVAGIGMTTALGLAVRVIDDLGAVSSPDAGPPRTAPARAGCGP